MAKATAVRSKVDAAPAVVGAVTDPAVIERAAEATARMGRSDRVFFWDKKQGVKVLDARGQWVPGPDVVLCGHDRTHGPLVMHGSGSLLMCGASKGGAPCTYNQPVSV